MCSRNCIFNVIIIVIIINIVLIVVAMLQNHQVMVTSSGFIGIVPRPSTSTSPPPTVPIVGVPVTSRGRWMRGDEGLQFYYYGRCTGG